MAKVKVIGILVLAVVLVFTSLIGLSCAPASEKGFPASDIHWIVPNKTGGGFDSYSRAIGGQMPKYLPNQVPIVFDNIPAAGGREGATKIYMAKPDGYTFGVLNIPGYIIGQLILPVQYDLTKMSYIGKIGDITHLCKVILYW